MFRSKMILTPSVIFLFCSLWMGYMAFVRTPPSTKLPQAMNSLSRSVQTREKVRKDIWLTAPTTGRLHHRIESDRSLVTLNPKGESIEVLEHLFGVRCWIQEKNGLRFVLAEEGTYKYNTQSFQAQDVLLSLYKIPQGILPTRLESYTPFLRGHADSITFSLQSGQPRFEAFHFQASLGENDL